MDANEAVLYTKNLKHEFSAIRFFFFADKTNSKILFYILGIAIWWLLSSVLSISLELVNGNAQFIFRHNFLCIAIEQWTFVQRIR